MTAWDRRQTAKLSAQRKLNPPRSRPQEDADNAAQAPRQPETESQKAQSKKDSHVNWVLVLLAAGWIGWALWQLRMGKAWPLFHGRGWIYRNTKEREEYTLFWLMIWTEILIGLIILGVGFKPYILRILTILR
jgi:hypothetical protein